MSYNIKVYLSKNIHIRAFKTSSIIYPNTISTDCYSLILREKKHHFLMHVLTHLFSKTPELDPF